MNAEYRVLAHVASGVGNILLATPLLAVLARNGFTVDLLISADYRGVEELFEGWSGVRTIYDGLRFVPPLSEYARVIPAIPPFYWKAFLRWYRGAQNVIPRPADRLFYRDEQAYYLALGDTLGVDVAEPPYYFVPTAFKMRRRPGTFIALAPGSKPAEMSAKRWPWFAELAEQFQDVVIVGTTDDLLHFNSEPMRFPGHARSFVGQLSLRATAEVMAGAAVVVANDCGLGHLAGALGVPTVLLFGPTSHAALGRLQPNVTVLRSGLACEPCWFSARFAACNRTMRCLRGITVDQVAEIVRRGANVARTPNCA